MFNDTAVFLFSPAHRRCPRSSAKYVAVDASSPHKRAKKHRFPRLQTGAGCPLHAIDISECTFFALLIYQFTIPKKYFTAVLFLHIVCNDPPCRNEMFTKLLQILLFPCGLQPFSMQNGEVYKLHSFSAEVYSFHPCRQFAEKIKSNICTFSSLISAICIFLFVRCFAIIIVYNGVCAEPPCTMMFSILGGEQK